MDRLKLWHLLRLAGAWLSAVCCQAQSATPDTTSTNIFAPNSTPADQIFGLSMFVLVVTGVIFAIVFSLLFYAAVKFRKRADDDLREPLQIYGSDQLELAWTVIPVLIVIVLFMTSARVIHSVQDAPRPPETIEVTVVGHQFWWEYRYPQYGFVTANELHVPVRIRPSDADLPGVALRRHRPQFLDSAAGGQDGPDSESSQQHLDRSA